MFEKATRLKLRFETPKGNVTIEDLWDLPLLARNGGVCLDTIAKDLNRKLKEADTESFVIKAPKADEMLQLRFDLVKHVIGVRLAEEEKADQLRAAKEKKQQLLAIIAQKESEQLMGASLDELKKMLESL